MQKNILLKVNQILKVAHDILEVELVAQDATSTLPTFSAGAHIEIKLKSNLIRSYSLANSPHESHRYVIAIHRSAQSRGGSAYIHDVLKVDDLVEVSAPRNHFPLDEKNQQYVLFAGGIGITPLLAMAYRLTHLKRRWEMHYCARSKAHAAYTDELIQLSEQSDSKVYFYFDSEINGRNLDLNRHHLDLNQLVQRLDSAAHLYCCGPKGMLTAFESATAHRKETAHLEYFTAKESAALEGGYEVELAKSNLILSVPTGKTILDVVFEAGISVPSSCREGICGSCETNILSGEADHRDVVLSDEEKESNQTMMICCSGSKSKKLVLDL